MLLSLSGNIIQGTTSLILILFISKIILWLLYKSSNKPGILPSFFMFFSNADIHDADYVPKKRFLKWSNRINVMVYFFLALMVFGFSIDTSQDIDQDKNPYHNPALRERYQNRKK